MTLDPIYTWQPAADDPSAFAQTLALLHAELARQTRRANEALALRRQCRPWISYVERELRGAIDAVLGDRS